APPPDTTNPTVSLTFPASGANVSGTVTIAASASDNIGVTKVDFMVNGTTVNSDFTAPYSYNWNTTGLSGSQVLSAKAFDAAGNNAVSSSISVVVQPPPPVTASSWIYQDSLQSPWRDTSWSSTNSYKSVEQVYAGSYSLKSVQGAWGAFSVHSGPIGSPVDIDPTKYSQFDFAIYNTTPGLILNVYCYNDRNDVFPNVLQNNVPVNQWTIISVPMSQLNPNSYVIHSVNIQNYTRLIPTYYLDNVHFVGVVANDTIPPSVTITNPLNGSMVSGAITISANASDNKKLMGVQFKLDGVNLGSELTTSPFSLSLNTLTCSNGTHSISATARDSAGLTKTATVTVTVNNVVSNPVQFPVRDNFDTVASICNLSGRNKWTTLANQPTSGAIQIVNNAIQPYSTGGVGTFGGVAWDSLCSGGMQVGLVVKQKGGNGSNSSFFIYTRMTSKDMNTGNGYRLRYLDNPSGVDLVEIQRVKLGTTGMTMASAYREINVGDTLRIQVRNDAMKTLVAFVNRDSVCSVRDTLYNNSSWYVWLRGCVFSTPVRMDNFMVGSIPGSPVPEQPPVTASKLRSILGKGLQTPGEFTLAQNYPNPFNPTTQIEYTLADRAFITLKIYNALGSEVAQLTEGEQDAGSYGVTWNAGNVASGIYFARLTASDVGGKQLFQQTKRMMLLK
ncbi:MAG: T9SS type A sorting domain-containing protein, partial [Ignavibacteria bacterium]|nr:T9SS type A sorting domain-containing protein [Ignavibacteria bacterium]